MHHSTSVQTTYADLECTGTLITGDWEGDASEPGCSRSIPAYIDDLCVMARDIDVTDLLSPAVIDEIEDRLLSEANDRY